MGQDKTLIQHSMLLKWKTGYQTKKDNGAKQMDQSGVQSLISLQQSMEMSLREHRAESINSQMIKQRGLSSTHGIYSHTENK